MSRRVLTKIIHTKDLGEFRVAQSHHDANVTGVKSLPSTSIYVMRAASKDVMKNVEDRIVILFN